jgi:SAM-dependent methyltransferase
MIVRTLPSKIDPAPPPSTAELLCLLAEAAGADEADGVGKAPLDYDLWRYLWFDNGPPADEAKKHLELRHVKDQLLAHGLRTGRGLDVGCATGRYPLTLAGLGFQVHGIDLNRTAIALCRAKSSGTCRVSFGEADFLRDPIPGPHDLMTAMMGTFNHVPKAQQAAFLARASDLLSPGGLLLFSSWNPESRHTGYLSFYTRAERERLRSGSRPADEILLLLSRAGWRGSKTIPFCFPPDNCLHEWELALENLAAVDDALASQLRPADSQMYLVVAEKAR